MITAQHIEAVVDAVDREMVALMDGFDACDVEIVRAARETAVEHFQQLVVSGLSLQHATRTAARWAARAAAPGLVVESSR